MADVPFLGCGNLMPQTKQYTMSCLDNNLHAARSVALIAGDYGKLMRYMGEVAFMGMARSYVGRHPSSCPNARWYARHLPDFLASVSPYAGMPELIELALLERALNDAGDAADAPAVTLADFAALAPERAGSAILDIHPSVRRFQVITNVTGLWSCLKCGEIPPRPSRLDAPQEILVWRQDGTSRFRLLGNEEALAFDAGAGGIRFGGIVERIAVVDDPDTAAWRAAGYLRGWIEAKAVSRIRFADAAVSK